MPLVSIGSTIFGPIMGLIAFFQNHHLLSNQKECPQCTTAQTPAMMTLEPRDDISDKFHWKCRRCNKRISLRDGSFFSKSKLSLQKWAILMYWWARQYAVTDAAEEAEVTETTACQIYQWLREVCSTKLINTPIVLGGSNVTVQIDESLFRHKPKYHRGRAPRTEQWVFGLVDTSKQPALGYMEIVPRRDAQTLLPIIRAHTAPGTTIHSDEWRAYSTVGQLPNVSNHSTINHSLHFVDPSTGVHTQHVESYWARVKWRFKSMKGVSSNQLPSYLDEFMWRERWGESKELAFRQIMAEIATQYPV